MTQTKPPLKAYFVHPRDEGYGFLIYAPTRNQAKVYSLRLLDTYYEYIELRARREPSFDQYAQGEEVYAIHGNDELPEGVSFYDEDEYY